MIPVQSAYKALLTLLLLLFVLPVKAQVEFQGIDSKVFELKPESSTGLNAVYVLEHCTGVTATFQGATSATRWYKFSKLGGGYAEEIIGATASLTPLEGNMGYIVENGTDRYYFWVVNYEAYPLTLSRLTQGEGSDCSTTVLQVAGEGAQINYYSINGREVVLDRGIKLTYYTEEFQDERGYVRTQKVQDLKSISGELHVPAPLCDTQFRLEGDTYLTAWGRGESVESETIQAMAVDCHVTATQTERNADNESKPGSGGDALGGSAPAEITFDAAVSSAAVFTEWQIATDPEFENIDLRYSETQVTHTFREMGTYYARFVCANSAGTCQQTSESFQIDIGDSMLQCPNAFSPDGDGTNDEWKVSYRSLTSFECHIFNRNGIKIISFSDPSQGWDGKYKGKAAPAGVYYYVIKATGSDGKKYDLGGDINIVNYK